MKVALPASGPPVVAPGLLAWAVVVDLVVALGFVVLGVLAAVRGAFTDAPWAGPALAGYGVLLAVADVAAGRMQPRGLTWRRRLGYVAIAALAWRGGPFQQGAVVTVLVVVWVGAMWIALVRGGHALSRAIAGTTGEDRPE
jgi:hypothetical protein